MDASRLGNASTRPTPRRGGSGRRAWRAGFTLIEMMVVTVVIVILASIITPRLLSTSGRTFELTVERVADLLVMYAHRDAVGAKPLGLLYDAPTRSLLLMELDDDEDGFPVWRRDPFVQPVRFPDEVDADSLFVLADGESVNVSDLPLAHRPGDQRPTLELFLASADGQYQATLELGPHAIAPRWRGRNGTANRVSQDLHSAGRSREDW